MLYKRLDTVFRKKWFEIQLCLAKHCLVEYEYIFETRPPLLFADTKSLPAPTMNFAVGNRTPRNSRSHRKEKFKSTHCMLPAPSATEFLFDNVQIREGEIDYMCHEPKNSSTSSAWLH